jgi:hypothetical protein
VRKGKRKKGKRGKKHVALSIANMGPGQQPLSAEISFLSTLSFPFIIDEREEAKATPNTGVQCSS